MPSPEYEHHYRAKRGEKHNMPWTTEEILLLKYLLGATEWPYRKIGIYMGRTYHSIRHRVQSRKDLYRIRHTDAE